VSHAKAIALPLHNRIISDAYTQERRRLFDFIRRRVPSEHDAEDILHDVFFSLSEHANVVEELNSITSWLFRVARNKITDLFRKRKTHLLEDVYPSESDPEEGAGRGYEELIPASALPVEDAMIRKNIRKTIDQTLETLPVDQRNVFVWHELEGRSFKWISEQTGDKIATLISRKRYAVVALREALQEQYAELIRT
jgi:RNA polymerase sigma factor (sigma-70 family)